MAAKSSGEKLQNGSLEIYGFGSKAVLKNFDKQLLSPGFGMQI